MPDPVQNFEPARRHVGTGPDTDKDGLSDDFERNVFHSDPRINAMPTATG